MPTSANVTTSEGLAFTVPKGARSLIIQNESDTAIRFRFGKTVSTTVTAGTATTGLVIPPIASSVPGEFRITFAEPLKNPVPVKAIHGGAGDKVLTWDAPTL